MNLENDMSDEEVAKAATEARAMVSRMLKQPVPDDAPVLYEKNTMMVKLASQWWVIIYGAETQPKEHNAMILLPYQNYFKHCNDMLSAIARVDGEGAAMKILASCGVDVTFVSDDDSGEDSPTLN